MQNISHVLHELKEEWIDDLKPAKNVGPEVTETLIKRLKVGPPTDVPLVTLTRLEQQRRLVDESGYFLSRESR